MKLSTLLSFIALAAGMVWLSAAQASDLEGTAWRLLNIASMDDSMEVPDDPNKYTLELGADGQAAMRADCNRGRGSWESKAASQISFGPIAATRAMCPPGSLSDSYLAQFQWVRSYVMKDGHLFLATMADGSIIEFEPLPPVVAMVLGEEIRAAEVSELQQAIFTQLMDQYAAEQGIVIEEAEIEAYLDKMSSGMAAQGLTAEEELTPDEAAQVEVMRRQMGEALIRQWKIKKSLYQTYGGRLIYQQLGPEPLDAYRQYLEERQEAGDFAIEDAEMKQAFWGYFTDESRHDFMEAGSADEANAFSKPPW